MPLLSYQKPNFFLIGASKCGTSALASYLREHPAVCFSDPKEPNFFNNDLHPNTYASFAEYYERVFQNPEQYSLVGEGSVRYIYSQTAVPNILTHNPKAKLIVMLRNPVDMCESWYYEQRAAGREDAPTLEAGWRRDHAPQEDDDAHVHLRHYQSFCRLGEQLARVYAHAAREQVLVLFYDDFARDSAATYRAALSFLGAHDDGRTDFPVVNKSRATFHPAVSMLLRSYGRAKTAARDSAGYRAPSAGAAFPVWQKAADADGAPARNNGVF